MLVGVASVSEKYSYTHVIGFALRGDDGLLERGDAGLAPRGDVGVPRELVSMERGEEGLCVDEPLAAERGDDGGYMGWAPRETGEFIVPELVRRRSREPGEFIVPELVGRLCRSPVAKIL